MLAALGGFSELNTYISMLTCFSYSGNMQVGLLTAIFVGTPQS